MTRSFWGIRSAWIGGLKPSLRRLTRRIRRGSGQIAADIAIPPDYYGWVEQLSCFHVAGYLHNRNDRSERTEILVRRGDTGELLARDRADHFRWGLAGLGVGDGGHGFHVRFPTALPREALGSLQVIAQPGEVVVPTAPYVASAYEPIMLISMDIVDNCNLRCPFCFYDYSNTRSTNLMDEATIDAALRFLPYVTHGNFWFSCVHEPTLHPEMIRFIDKVPRAWRKKVFFTSNIAKRMPAEFFVWLADAGLNHINISIESLVPEIYERMRKGARFRIFMENWDKLIEATAAHAAPTPIHYIAMVYRSNYRELPGLARYLLDERRASLVELRYTFEREHIPKEFRDEEFLDREGWLWLRDELAGFSGEQVMLVMPPGLSADTPKLGIELQETLLPKEQARPQDGVRHFLPGRYQCSLSWDGTLKVNRYWAHPYEGGRTNELITAMNVKDIADPVAFLAGLPLL